MISILAWGLAGFGAAKYWRSSQELSGAESDSAAKSEMASAAAPRRSRPAGMRERSNPEAQHVKLLDHPKPGGSEALALLEQFAAERFEVIGGSRTFHKETLLRQMYQEDRDAALRFIDGVEDGEVAARLVSLMLFAPDRSEIPRLKEWMENQEDPVLRSEILRCMIWTWRSYDGHGALAAIAALPQAEGIDRSKLRALVMERIPVRVQLDLMEALPLADREAFLATHGETLSRNVPEEIFAGIMNLPDSPGRQGAMSSVVRGWAARDPLRAIAAVETLNKSDEEPLILRELAYGWSSVDSLRASKWVDEIPLGPSRDAASAGLAEELAIEQPDMAFRWAERIADVDLRLESLRHVLATWRGANSQAAESALKGAQLNESDRRALAPITKPSNP